MLIKSNFRDYYDNIGGVDKSIIYNRVERKFVWNNNTITSIQVSSNPWGQPSSKVVLEPNSNEYKAFLELRKINKRIVDSHDVVYSLWPGLKYRPLKLGVIVIGNKIFPVIIYDEDQCFYNYSSFFEELKKTAKKDKDLNIRFTETKWNQFYESCKRLNFVKIQSLVNSPILTYNFCWSDIFHNTSLKVDCNLKKYNVISQLDPYQTNQEIAMFISGVLKAPEKELVEITDEKTLLAKHGMGAMSFKQGSPGIKKQRRKQNKKRKRK